MLVARRRLIVGVAVAAVALIVLAAVVVIATGVLSRDDDQGATDPGSVAASAQRETASVMLYGDSVTEGTEGDWTWRYRLAKHLADSGTDVDLVGPSTDLMTINAPGVPNHDYLDPDFDQNHAAVGGASYLKPPYDISRTLRMYHPDVLVVLLGVNDIAFYDTPPAQVDQAMRAFVEQARAVDPEIDLIFGALPQTWFEAAATYNDLLRGTAEELSTDASPIVVADTDEDFTIKVDTWDTAHPTAQGEVKLAAAMADALARIGVGTPYPRPLPPVVNGPREAGRLSAEARDGAVELSWTDPVGSRANYIEMRDLTEGQEWTQLPAEVAAGPWTGNGLTNGHVYEFRLRPVRGYWAAAPDVRSNVVRVTPTAGAPRSS